MLAVAVVAMLTVVCLGIAFPVEVEASAVTTNSRTFSVFEASCVQATMSQINNPAFATWHNEIVIMQDITLAAPITINDRNVTLTSRASAGYALSGGGNFLETNSLILVENGGTLTIDRGVLIEHSHGLSNATPAISVEGGVLNFVNGTVRDSHTGIRVTAGTLNMNGGTVSGNSVDGIRVEGNGTVNMTTGTVTGNSGSGIRVNGTTGTLNMNGGSIANNPGHGITLDNALVTMTGGTIEHNNYHGINALDGSTINMTGGVINSHNANLTTNGIRAFANVAVNLSGGARIIGHNFSINVTGPNSNVNIQGATIINNVTP